MDEVANAAVGTAEEEVEDGELVRVRAEGESEADQPMGRLLVLMEEVKGGRGEREGRGRGPCRHLLWRGELDGGRGRWRFLDGGRSRRSREGE